VPAPEKKHSPRAPSHLRLRRRGVPPPPCFSPSTIPHHAPKTRNNTGWSSRVEERRQSRRDFCTPRHTYGLHLAPEGVPFKLHMELMRHKRRNHHELLRTPGYQRSPCVDSQADDVQGVRETRRSKSPRSGLVCVPRAIAEHVHEWLYGKA
jgi:hypothetical protein